MTKTSLSAALLVIALNASSPAFAHIVQYVGSLGASAEADPTNTSIGSGSVIVTVDEDNFTMRVQTSFQDLTGNVTAAHIHCCTVAAGTGNAGVATPLPTFPGFPSGVSAGSYDQTFDMTQAASYNPAFVTANGGTTGAAFSALITGLAGERAYLNIHTTYRAGGEIRAVLAPVPEPGTWAMFLGGLGLLGATTLRRRRA